MLVVTTKGKMIRAARRRGHPPGPQHHGRAHHRPRCRRPGRQHRPRRGRAGRASRVAVAVDSPGLGPERDGRPRDAAFFVVCVTFRGGNAERGARPGGGATMLDLRADPREPEAVERALATRGGAELVPEILEADADAPPAPHRGRGRSRPSATAPPRPSARPSAAARTPRPRWRACARSPTASRRSTPRCAGRRPPGAAPAPAARTCRTLGAGGPQRRRQRRDAPLGRAAALRLRAQAPRRPRRGARPARLRARGEDRQVALRGAVGGGGAARARARPVHAGPAHAASTASPRCGCPTS